MGAHIGGERDNYPTYQGHNEAIARLRALTGLGPDGAWSIAVTAAALGITKAFLSTSTRSSAAARHERQQRRTTLQRSVERMIERMTMLLAGDIGGTKTDLAIFSPEAGPRTPLVQREFRSAQYSSLAAMVRVFLAEIAIPVDRACFAVAGPVIGGAATITNLPWILGEAELARELGLTAVLLMNDLEALARAIPFLQPEDLHVLNGGQPHAEGAIAVIAPGTGLGEAFLTWDGLRYSPHASEGGHADFAPTDDRQVELLRYMLRRYDHVSYEHVCSGIGIPNIYHYLRDAAYAPEPPGMAQELAQGSDATRLIAEAALRPAAPDALCVATLDLFLAILGAEAGNLALKVLATGGVYIGGGIPAHIAPALDNGRFMAAFTRKGRFADLLRHVPVRAIVRPSTLLGTASYGLAFVAPRERDRP